MRNASPSISFLFIDNHFRSPILLIQIAVNLAEIIRRQCFACFGLFVHNFFKFRKSCLTEKREGNVFKIFLNQREFFLFGFCVFD